MKFIHIITPKWRQPEDLHPTPFDAYRFRGGAGALVRFSYQMERPVGVEPTNAAFAVPYPADECWTHKTACNIFKVAMKPKKLRLFTIYNAVNQGVGGSEGLRSLYLLLARQALYQLSYTPIKCGWIANPSYLPTSARRTHLQIIVILCKDEGRKILTSVQTQCPKWESNPQNSGSKPDTYSIRLPGHKQADQDSNLEQRFWRPLCCQLHHQPMVGVSYRYFARCFPISTVPRGNVQYRFPTPWSGILDLNQGLPRYQHGTLPTELMPDEASPVPK